MTLPSMSRFKSAAAARPVWLYLLLAFALAFLTEFGAAKTLFLQGLLRDTDDALRLVEVRDFMAGQSWFDLHQYRMNPPQGLLMHWSRLIDLPLAALISFFHLFTPLAMAETLARFAWPMLLQAGLFATVLLIARKLAGPAALFPAAIVLGFAYIVTAQFEPGRIDHHSAQLLLSALGLLTALRAYERVYFAALTGIIAAVMMAIGFEALSVIAAFGAFFAGQWIAAQKDSAARLQAFGAGFAFAATMLFLATIPQAQYFDVYCDAQSFASLLLAIGAGGCSLLLGALSPFLKGAFVRFLTAGLAGGGLLALLSTVAGQCGLDPLSQVPADMRGWLDSVFEAKGLILHLRENFLDVLPFAGPLLVAAACAAAAFYFHKNDRWRWGLAAGLCLVQAIITLNHLRAVSSAILFGLPAISWCLVALRTRSQAAMAVLYVLSIPAAWALPLLFLDEPQAVTLGDCSAPQSFSAISALPKSRVLAPIDLGSHLLAYTPHEVYGAPYHRNLGGMRFVFATLYEAPPQALAKIRERKPDYVLLCENLGEFKGLQTASPDSLAARLFRGETVKGLIPVQVPQPMLLWRIDYSKLVLK